jgi:hypothetical protein
VCLRTYLVVVQQAIEGNYGVNVKEFELDPDVYFAKSRSILSSTLCSRCVLTAYCCTSTSAISSAVLL